jgi:hypothetical protein
MAFDAVLGKQTFEDKQIIDTSHPAVIVTQAIKENQGILQAGQIVAYNSAGKVVPYAKYEYLSEQVDNRQTIGAGDGSNRTFSGTLTDYPVASKSAVVTAGTVTGYDDGCGRIYGTGISGTINYETGEISVTFSSAPANGVAVKVAYANRPVGVLTTDIDTTKETAGNVLIHGCVVGANLLAKAGNTVTSASQSDIARLNNIYAI